MADQIQLDGKTYMPIMEAASLSRVPEAKVRALAQEGKVFLRAIGKKVYVDLAGLQRALQTLAEPASPKTPTPSAGMSAPQVAPAPISLQTEKKPDAARVSAVHPTVSMEDARKVLTPTAIPKPALLPQDAPIPAVVAMKGAVATQPVLIAQEKRKSTAASRIAEGKSSDAPTPSPLPPVAPSVPLKVATPAPSAPRTSAALSAMMLPPKQMIDSVPGSRLVPVKFVGAVAGVLALVTIVSGGYAIQASPTFAKYADTAAQMAASLLSFDSPDETSNVAASGSVVLGPSEYQATAQAATYPVAASTTQPIYYVYNYPVIERVKEEVRYISQDSTDFQSQLDALYEKLQSQIHALNINTGTNFAQQYQVIAQTNKIDHLGNVDIDSSTITGGTISGASITDGSISGATLSSIPSATITGNLTTDSLTVSGSATTTFSGALLATRAPTIPHTFGSWTTGASNSAWADAALVVNTTGAVGDSNLISASVDGSVKFLVDAEGDVFVNNLTSVGSVTLSTTTASTFTVEGSTTLGDSLTDVTTINGSLIVTGSTTVAASAGKFGVGTSTPWATLSVQASGGQGYPLFQIASSSTSLAYLTVANDGNFGVGTTSPLRKFAVSNTAASAQVSIAYSDAATTELQTDSAGDFIVNPSGDDVFLNDDDLWVCSSGSCPAGTPVGNGNLIVETALGVGTSTPAASLATAGLLFVGANDAAGAGTATSTFYGDIQIYGKLDVSTIDPVYTIDGVKYATYGHSTVGVKEEVVTKLQMTRWDAESGLYKRVISFDDLEKGSDLWLFYQVTDFGKSWENLIVSLTPGFNGFAFYEHDRVANTLTVYASQEGEVSMRLVANRYDFTKWGNLRTDQEDRSYLGHEIMSK